MCKIDWDNLLKELKDEKYSFGELLREIRTAQKIAIRKVAKEVELTPAYISDIERGNNKPPKQELIDGIANALNIQETEVRYYLYDLAAIERGGVSGDIAEYIMGNSNLRMTIRMAQRKNSSDPSKGDEFWAECLSKIKTK